MSTALWRKERGRAWERLGEDSLGNDPSKVTSVGTFELLAVGDHVVCVGNTHRPAEQLHAVRVSEDDGATFRPLAVSAKGAIVTSSAVVDPQGGVLIAGFGGLLLRVTVPPG